MLAEKACKNKLLVFIGAGASIGDMAESGLPSGSKLNQLLIDYYEEQDNLTDQPLDKVTEYIEKKYGRKILIEKIYETIKEVTNPLKTHRLISELPIKIFVTTNYDDLLEKSLKTKNKQINRITSDSDITSISNNEINIFKIHGCVTTKEDDIIITESDYYEKFLLKSNLYIDILKAWLSTHTCLFIGYSLSDVNLKYLFFEISKKIGVENIKGRFYAIQRNPLKSDIEIWEKRGFIIVSEDKNTFLDNLIEEIEFKDIEKHNNSLISRPTLSIGKLELNEVKSYEQKNGKDGQRFILMTERKMKFLNAEEGDWLKLDVEQNDKVRSQFARVYQDNSVEGDTIRLPLVTRNLLKVSSVSNIGNNFKMTICKAEIKKLDNLIIDTNEDEVSQLPIELDRGYLKEDTPVIAIRNFEFMQLDMQRQKECKILVQGEIEKTIIAKVVLFDSKYNPGRAIIGINSNFRRLITDAGDNLKLTISSNND